MAEIVPGLFGQVRTPMRFWTTEKLLHRNKRYCQDDCDYRLITPSHYLPDFQIVRPLRPDPINFFQLQYEDGTVVIDSVLGPDFIGGVETTAIGNYEYITYRGRLILQADPRITQPLMGFADGGKLDCTKVYRIVIGDGVDTWTSEPFKAVDAMADDGLDLLDGNGVNPNTTNGWAEDTGTWIYGSGACKQVGADAQISYQIPGGYLFYYAGGRRAHVVLDIGSLDYASLIDADIEVLLDGFVIGTIPANSTEDTYEFEGMFSNLGIVSLRAEENVEVCFSNVFVYPVTDNLECHLKLTWTNECDIFNMLNTFETFDGYPLQNEYFLPEDTELGKPDYKATTEGTENGDKKIVESFKKRSKRYFLEFGLIPEYILDALFDMQFFETITLHLKRNAGTQAITEVDVDYTWRFSDQCYATTNISFGFGDDGVETGCCDNLTQVPCPEPCSNEIEGLLEETETPIEGGLYISNAAGQVIVTYHDPGPNDETACESGWAQINGTDVFYFFDGSEWQKVGVQEIVKLEQFNLNDTEAVVYGFIPPGYFAQLEIVCGGNTVLGLTKYTPTELASGIEIEPCDTEFTVRVYYGNANCEYQYSDDYDVDWGLRMKVSKGTHPGFIYDNVSYPCVAVTCNLNPSNIDVDDFAALEAAIEGGVCNTGTYNTSDDVDFFYVEKTDSDIFVVGCQFYIYVTDGIPIPLAFFVFDREHLEFESGQ